MNKKYLLIIVLCVLFALAIIFNIKTSQKEDKNINKLKVTNFELKERVTINQDNELVVGENEKEIENGFFDLKVINEEDEITILLNKLWYKKCNENYIEDDYLANICRKIVENLNLNDNNEDLEYILYKYIKENYLKARMGEKIENIVLDKMIISLDSYLDMARLKIKGA